MAVFNIEPDPEAEPPAYVGTGGYEIDNSSEHHRRMTTGRKKADLVSAAPERGGITKPAMRFRAFNAGADGLTVTNARTKINRAPDQHQELPISSFEGVVIAPGLPPVPKAVNVNPNPPDMSLPAPSAPSAPSAPQAESSSLIVMPLGVTRPAAGDSQRESAPTKSVTFIGEFSDHQFPCFDIRVDESGWLTLISPCLNQLKLKSEQEVEITVDGQTATYWFTGIVIPLPEFNRTVRVFGTVHEQ